MATGPVFSASIVDGLLEIAINFGINKALSNVHTNLFATIVIVSISEHMTPTTVEDNIRGFVFTPLPVPKNGQHTVQTGLYNIGDVEVTTLMKVKIIFTVVDSTVSNVSSKVLLESMIYTERRRRNYRFKSPRFKPFSEHKGGG